MSTTNQNHVPKKGDLVINPKTSRPIKVGSRVWLTLVKEGLLAGFYQDTHQLAEVKDGENVDEKIQELNKNLPINQQAVRGRGKYANKIVKRSKPPSTRDTIKHTARTTAKKIKDPEVYEQLHEGEDFEAQLEKMIMEELAGLTASEPIPIPQKVPQKVQRTRQPRLQQTSLRRGVGVGSQKQQQHQREYYGEPERDVEYYEETTTYEDETEGDYYGTEYPTDGGFSE